MLYFHPGWQVLEERLTGTPEAAPTDRQFVWGLRYIDELLCRDRRTSAASTTNPLDERLYALHDANWNITAIVSASGAVMQRLSYSPYGEPRGWTATFEPSPSQPLSNSFAAAPTSSDPLGWEHSYCGYRWDDQPGLYPVRHRVLHPVLGLWVQRDPIGYIDGPALHQYVNSSPVVTTDPSGLRDWRLLNPRRRSLVCPPERRVRRADAPPIDWNGCTSSPDGWTYRGLVYAGRQDGTVTVVEIRLVVRFKDACDSHDVCYQTCGMSKQQCDRQFLGDMYALCRAHIPRGFPTALNECLKMADRYYAAVANIDSFFDSSQATHCCCR